MFFMLSYSAAVIGSFLFLHSGTLNAIVWPSVGIAVWWTVTCRSWSKFAYICTIVFLVPALYLLLLTETSLPVVILVSTAHVVSGPLVALALVLAKKVDPTETSPDGQLFTPFSKITVARHVYRLLIVGLVMVSVSQLLVVFAYVLSATPVSLTLYLTLVLRGLTSIIAIAGPGIAISSSMGRKIKPSVWREFVVVNLVTIALLGLMFGYAKELPTVYLALLPLYWSATRLPVALAAVHAVLTAAVATILYYLVDTGPFAISAESAGAEQTAVQVFVIMCVLLSLVVATTVQRNSALLEQLDVLANTLPDALLIVARDGRAFPVNEAAYDLVSRLPGNQFVMRELNDIQGEPLEGQHCPRERAFRGESVAGQLVRLSETHKKDSEVASRIYNLSAAPMYLPGETEPGHALLLYQDSTSEHRTMEQLTLAYEESHVLFENSPTGSAILKSTGEIIQANLAFAELVGIAADKLVGRTLDDFSTEKGIIDEAKPVLETPKAVLHFDRSFQTAQGQTKNVALSFRAVHADNYPTGSMLVDAVDVTERQNLLDRVAHLADHDPLTGLLNRRRLESDFEKVFAESQRKQNDGALLILDLDNFKEVNDSRGHHVGDKLLVEFSEILKECVRLSDIVGRMGGDEFVIVLPNTQRSGAESISTRIVEEVRRQSIDLEKELFRVTVSIGFVMFSEARAQGVDPFILADQALYIAKNAGKNRFSTIEDPKEIKQTERPKITVQRIQELLDSGAFWLELQPILEIATGRVDFAEGLLRICEDTVDITTGEFVKAVERAELGPKLDSFVLREGLSLIEEMRQKNPAFCLSLNMSAQSLASNEFRMVLESELREHALSAAGLVIEITETAPLHDLKAAQELQNVLERFGVTLALDDFGVGYDPYRYLKLLNFKYLKIAGEFVEQLPLSDVDRNIVESIIHLARDEGLKTIAEFVSDKQVFDAVVSSNVEYAQGFYVGASLSPDEFTAKYFDPKAEVGICELES